MQQPQHISWIISHCITTSLTGRENWQQIDKKWRSAYSIMGGGGFFFSFLFFVVSCERNAWKLRQKYYSHVILQNRPNVYVSHFWPIFQEKVPFNWFLGDNDNHTKPNFNSFTTRLLLPLWAGCAGIIDDMFWRAIVSLSWLGVIAAIHVYFIRQRKHSL